MRLLGQCTATSKVLHLLALSSAVFNDFQQNLVLRKCTTICQPIAIHSQGRIGTDSSDN
jgi:hypothetical protein